MISDFSGDFDTIFESPLTLYTINGASHAPTNEAFLFKAERAIKENNNGRVVQQAWEIITGTYYYRIKQASTWSSWRQVCETSKLGIEYPASIFSKTYYLGSKRYLEIALAQNWYAVQIQVFGYAPNFNGVVQVTVRGTEVEVLGKLHAGTMTQGGATNKVFYTGGKIVLYTDVTNSQLYVIASTRFDQSLLTLKDYTTYDISGMTQLTFA